MKYYQSGTMRRAGTPHQPVSLSFGFNKESSIFYRGIHGFSSDFTPLKGLFLPAIGILGRGMRKEIKLTKAALVLIKPGEVKPKRGFKRLGMRQIFYNA